MNQIHNTEACQVRLQILELDHDREITTKIEKTDGKTLGIGENLCLAFDTSTIISFICQSFNSLKNRFLCQI